MKQSSAKIKIFFILAASFAGMFFQDYALSKKPDQDLTDPNKVILLKSNPTTGYIWLLVSKNDEDAALIQPVSHHFKPLKSNLKGAPGVEIWRFQIKKSAFVVPRMFHLTMQYARPWVVTSNARQLRFTFVTVGDD